MSILNVNQLQPVGGGNTITVGSSNIDYSGSITGNISVDGNLTVTGVVSHEDVTNIDSVGVITARSGLHVTSGSVGIGTDNPGAALEVFGPTTSTMYIRGGGAGSDAARQATLGLYASGSKIYNLRADASDGSFRILDSSTERLRITSSGVKQVKNGNLNINSTYIDFSGDVSTPATAAAIFRPADNTLAFSTANVERVRINSAGHMGVGNNDPTQAKLVAQTASGMSIAAVKDNTGASISLGGVTQPRVLMEAGASASEFKLYTAGGSSYGSASWVERLLISNIGQLTTKGNNQGNPVGIEIRNNNTNAYSHAQLSLTSQNGTTSKIWCDVPNSGMRLNYNGGSSVKIDQSGNLHMPNGAGIDFSATGNSSGTMSSELLDDYEEGSWVPSFSGRTLGVAEGTYTKIGRQVLIQFNIANLNSSISAGNISINGLPFQSRNINQNGAVFIADTSGVTYSSGYGRIYGRINAAGNSMQLLQRTNDGSTHTTAPALGTGLVLRGYAWYTTD